MAKQKNDKRRWSALSDLNRPPSPLVGTGIGRYNCPDICVGRVGRSANNRCCPPLAWGVHGPGACLCKRASNFYDAIWDCMGAVARPSSHTNVFPTPPPSLTTQAGLVFPFPLSSSIYSLFSPLRDSVMSVWTLSSAGRRVSLGSISFLTLSLLIARGTCSPMMVHRSYMHHLHARAPNGSTSSTESQRSASKSDDGDSVFSPKNSFFPVMVVVVTATALILLVALCLYIRWLMKKPRFAKDTETLSARTMAEKFDVPSQEHPSLTLPRPVASSVARGSSARFNLLSNSPTPFQVGTDFMDESIYPAYKSHPVSKSQRNSVFSDYASTFSLDSKGSAEAASLRQTDLSQPCVTHGSPNWIIQAYEDDNDADVSYTQMAHPR